MLAAAAAPALCAPEQDPLKSDACKAALVELEQAGREPASNARAARVAHAREQAAVACLGHSQGRAARSGAPYPVQAVPPVNSAVRAQPALPAVTAPAPPAATPRPAVITTCDPAGCWDSDGRRLNQVGPLLMSPRGPCTTHGGVVNCP